MSKRGFNPDGKSEQKLAPKPVSTPNKVEAIEKAKKGKIPHVPGKNEEAELFDDIHYSGNTTDYGKGEMKSIYEKDVFEGIEYDNEGFTGTPKYAAGEKDTNYSKEIEPKGDAKHIAKAVGSKKKYKEPEKAMKGKNPSFLKKNGDTVPFKGFKE